MVFGSREEGESFMIDMNHYKHALLNLIPIHVLGKAWVKHKSDFIYYFLLKTVLAKVKSI